MKTQKGLEQIVVQEQNSSKPRFNFFHKTLAAWLMTGFLGVGMLARANTPKDEQTRNPAPITSTLVPDAQMITPEQMYNSYIQQGAEYAQKEGDENKQKAMELFAKAINEVGVKKALSMKTTSLDEKTEKIYSNMLKVAQFNDMMSEEKKKEESKSHLGTYLLIGGGAVAIATAIYFLTKKSSNPTPPPPVKDTINLDAVNASKPETFKTLTSRTVTAGSSVTVTVNETGITGDPNYIAVYNSSYNQKIATGTAGSVTFTAPSPTTDTTYTYHVFVFNKLGTNNEGAQVSYDWVKNANITQRNITVFRKDYDGQTMEERVWGGANLPELGGKPGAFDQENLVLTKTYNGVTVTWGHFDRQPNSTTGAWSYGAGNSEGGDGYHYGDHITVNAKKLGQDVKREAAVAEEELTEKYWGLNNIGGYPSEMTIESSAGIIGQNGIDLLIFTGIWSNASFTSSSTGAAAMQSAINTIDVHQQLGPVEIGLNSGKLHAGFQNGSVGVNTNFSMNGAGVENYTAANFTGEKFQAGLQMNRSSSQETYAAQTTLTIDKVVVGVSGGYDAKNRIGNVAANIGAKVGDGNVMVGFAGTPGMFGFNVQATQALKDIGIIGFHGLYTKNQLAAFASMGLDAQLDHTPIGALRIIGDYTKSGVYKYASLGIGKQLGPGVLSFSMGTDQKLDARYTMSIKF